MNITIAGTGYVGLSDAVLLAQHKIDGRYRRQQEQKQDAYKQC